MTKRFFAVVWFLISFSLPAFSQNSLQVKELLAAEPDSLALKLSLADALGLERKHSAALQVLEDLLPSNPRNPVILEKIAFNQFSLKQYETAKETYFNLLRCQPGSLDARYGLIRLYSELMDWERVKTQCFEILKINRQNFFSYLNLGLAEFNLRNFSQAYDWYNLPIFRKNRAMRLGQGWCLLRMNRFDEARSVFQELCRDFPYDSECLKAFKEADILTAKKDLTQVAWTTRLTSAEVGRYLEFAKKSRLSGKLQDALDLVTVIVEQDPHNLPAIVETARIYSELGNWNKADYYYSVYLNQKPDREGYSGKVLSLSNLGRTGEAAKYAASLLKLEKNSLIANQALGDYKYQIGEFKNALDFYNQPKIASIHILEGKGWSQLNLKNFEEARKAFEAILSREPGNQSALEGLKEIQNSLEKTNID